MKNRIALFYPVWGLELNPSLVSMLNLLADAGYVIEVYTLGNSAVISNTFLKDSIKIVNRHKKANQTSIALSPYISLSWLEIVLIIYKHIFHKYICFIGVDHLGLIESSLLTRFMKVPIIYYSMELLFLDELDNNKKSHSKWIDIKQKEIEISKNCEFIIIQDQERAKILSEINNISLSKFLTVPNSPLELARINKSSYWHNRFGLSDNKRVVLHTGDIKKWTAIGKIIDSVKDWPQDWVLVIHTYNDDQDLLDNFKNRATPGRIFFSTSVIENESFTEMIDGADIGIAFYETIKGKTFVQKNIINIGLSSGKIAYCLRSGLPIIINKVTTFSKIVDNEECGICVNSAGEIKEAISRIEENYEEFRQRACETFNKYFDYKSNFKSVIQRIESIATN